MVREKRGASHVDIILSFVLFVSFIIFIFIVFNPFKISLETISDLDITEKKILENLSVNLSAFAIRILDSVYSSYSGESCFSIDSVNQPLELLPLVMVDKNGLLVNTKVQGGKIYFENSGDFYTLYHSEELESNEFSASSCFDLAVNDYKIGVIKFYEIVSYSKLINLRDDYNGDYDGLKQTLGLENDFNIDISKSPEIIFEPTKKRPGNIEIIAKNVLITILNRDANLKPDIMNIQVWG